MRSNLPPRRLPISRGLSVLVDDLDYMRASAYRWSAFPCSGGRRFRARRQYLVPETGRKVTVSLAHFILGADPNMDAVRHLNGDTLDCRRENLAATNRRGRPSVDPNTGRPFRSIYTSEVQAPDPLDEEYPE